MLEAFAAFGESTSSDGDFKSVAKGRDKAHVTHEHADTGTAARFFCGSKAGARDRVIHCTACGARAWATDWDAHRHGRADFAHLRSHPAVKSQALMAYLCKLACPPGGTVLDPFAGSGSTGQAALTAGFAALLIEREADTSQTSSFAWAVPSDYWRLGQEAGVRRRPRRSSRQARLYADGDMLPRVAPVAMNTYHIARWQPLPAKVVAELSAG